MAPEVISSKYESAKVNGEEQPLPNSCVGYNEKCDIWSIGVIIYVMLIKEAPIRGDDEEDMKKNILNFHENGELDEKHQCF